MALIKSHNFVMGIGIPQIKRKLPILLIFFLVNVGPTLAAKIDACSDASFRDFMNPSINKSIFLDPVCEKEVVKITPSFKTKKSCGYDSISMILVKSVISSIKVPMTYICN